MLGIVSREGSVSVCTQMHKRKKNANAEKKKGSRKKISETVRKLLVAGP